MRILIANDDGIDAPGLHALCEVLTPHHEISVVAPNKERSAMGHALTLHRPLRVEDLPPTYIPGVKEVYAIDGTPTDCVKIAINNILPEKPDLVVSGINHGPNMGSDVLYSGTVSVAVEGAIYGIKSIAFSISEYKASGFQEPAKAIPGLIDKLYGMDDIWLPMTLFNVNIPTLPYDEMKGIAITPLGDRMYKDFYERRIDPRGRYYYWLSGDLLQSDPNPASDVSMTAKGYISITPLTLNMTNFKLIDQMTRVFNPIANTL